MERKLTLEEAVEEIVGRVLLADTPANDCLVPAQVLSAVVDGQMLVLGAVPDRTFKGRKFKGREVRSGGCLPGFIIPSEINEDEDGVIRIRGSLPSWAGGEDRTQIFLPPKS